MDWPSLDRIVLVYPDRLFWAVAATVIVVATAVWRFRRRGVTVVPGLLVLRLLAVGLLGLALAAPYVPEPQAEPPVLDRPARWRLELPGGQEREAVVPTYREPADLFLARLRSAVAEERAPRAVEVAGEREGARRAAGAVRALGIPCTVLMPEEAGSADPRSPHIRAPRFLQPGEPLEAWAQVAESAGELRLLLDGEEVAVGPAISPAAWPSDPLSEGKHLLEAEPVLPDGSVGSRSGTIVRVGERPKVLVVDPPRGERVHLPAEAQTWFETSTGAIEDLSVENLAEVSTVVLPLGAAQLLSARQSHALMQYVANGGGLFLTADGVEGVNPSLLPVELRELSPLRVLEQERDTPEKPPVKEESGKAEVAAVSIAFLLDRSASMDQSVQGGATRWQIAVKSVEASLEKVNPWDRAGVMTFTLEASWRPSPKVIAPFDREFIARDLKNLRSDNQFDPRGYNTDIYKAVEAALAVMENEPSAVKVLVLLTDGGDRDEEGGAPRNHRGLAERAIASGINIVTLGIGDEFYGSNLAARGARKVIEDLATSREFAYIAPDADSAKTAPAVFVQAVETAYEAWDEEMARREAEKKKRADEAEPGETPPTPDLRVGSLSISGEPAGLALLPGGALPDPPPRLNLLARTELRKWSVRLLNAGAEGDPLLAAKPFGAGRVAFWAAPTSVETQRGLAGWSDWPGLLAHLLRWLSPSEEPLPSPVREATSRELRLDEAASGALFLRTQAGDIPLAGEGLVLRAAGGGELPLGPAELLARAGESERLLADVYVSAGTSPPRALREDWAMPPPPMEGPARPVVESRSDWPAWWLVATVLLLMPVERALRRRS